MSSLIAPSVETRRPRSSRWRQAGLPAIVLLCSAVIYDGSLRRPRPPTAGVQLNGVAATPSPATTFRVASFNIHGCRDVEGHFDPERTAEALRGFDLIGLNEVRGGWEWQRPDQAELLGQRLDMPWLFAPTEWRWWREDFGNGLLCRLSVARWQRLPLRGTRHKGHRNRVLAEVRHGPATIHVIVTHLDRVQDRAAQLKEVTDEFLKLPEPALLMGDLNTAHDDPYLASVLATPGVRDLVGETSARDSSRRIDWILARGLRPVRGGLVDTGASDHPLVWAEVGCRTPKSE